MNVASTRRQAAAMAPGKRFPMFVSLSCVTLLFVFGGATRPDSFAQLPVRLVSIIVIGLLLFAPRRGWWRPARRPLLFAAAVAILLLLQLVPLPPELWRSLSGHRDFSSLWEFPQFAGIWRPLSVEPDLTINALMSLIPVLAAILVATLIPVERYHLLTMFLVGMLALSGLIGMAQLASGGNETLYPFRITNMGSAVGLFANRNHEAIALAVGFPLLAIWNVVRDGGHGRIADMPFIFCGLFLASLILATGSRSGLLMMIVGIGGAALLVASAPSPTRGARAGRNWRWAVPVLGIILAVGLVFLLDTESTRRIFQERVSSDPRAASFGPIVELVRHYFPLGSGFGTFADVYKSHETLALLGPTYLNHAHNDLLELALDGGLPGIVMLVIFLYWWVRTTKALWRQSPDYRRMIEYGKGGSVITAILLLASLMDYPLRAPAIAMIFAIACCWMEFGGQAARQGECYDTLK